MYEVGSYWAKPVSAVLSTSKGGNPQLAVQFHVTHQAAAGQWQPCEEADRYVYMSLHGGAVPYTEAKLFNMGFNGDFSNPQFSGDVLANGMEIVCGRSNTGKEQWELPRGEFEVAPA